MKYVRTKDGIYKYADYLGVHNDKRYALMDDAQGNRITMCQEPEELYEVADTIEELCDEYVMVSELEKKPYVTKGGYKGICEGFEHIKECGRKASFYGAIWVTGARGEPTLKPIAELNDKGEWELL